MRMRCLAVAAISAMAFGMSAGPSLAAGSTHTLTVTTKLIKQLDSGHNEITFAELLRGKAVIGTDEGDCVFGSPVTRCSAAYALTGGMLYASVRVTSAGETARITGGTGTYAGSRGVLDIEHLTPSRLKLTFHYTL